MSICFRMSQDGKRKVSSEGRTSGWAGGQGVISEIIYVQHFLVVKRIVDLSRIDQNLMMKSAMACCGESEFRHFYVYKGIRS